MQAAGGVGETLLLCLISNLSPLEALPPLPLPLSLPSLSTACEVADFVVADNLFGAADTLSCVFSGVATRASGDGSLFMEDISSFLKPALVCVAVGGK